MSSERRSAAAVLAIALAAIAFFVNPLLGFFLGLGAVLVGLVGFLRSAASTRVRGGLLSLGAIALGAVAMAVQIVHGALRLIF